MISEYVRVCLFLAAKIRRDLLMLKQTQKPVLFSKSQKLYTRLNNIGVAWGEGPKN